VIDEVMPPSARINWSSIVQARTLFGFFVGQVMKASKGKANPKIVKKTAREAEINLECGGQAACPLMGR